jgi:hypothetical protein
MSMTVSEYQTMIRETVTMFRCYGCIESAADIRFVVRDGLGVSGDCDGCGGHKFMLPVRVDKGEI